MFPLYLTSGGNSSVIDGETRGRNYRERRIGSPYRERRNRGNLDAMYIHELKSLLLQKRFEFCLFHDKRFLILVNFISTRIRYYIRLSLRTFDPTFFSFCLTVYGHFPYCHRFTKNPFHQSIGYDMQDLITNLN